MEFETDNIQSVKGRQPGKWDYLLAKFVNPGDRIKQDPAKLSSQTASVIAKRMCFLDPSRVFHSGLDIKDNVRYIRVRVPGELVEKEEAAELELEGGEEE